MANRFQEKFLAKLVEFSQENGFVITEGGVLEPIGDWVEAKKDFEYTTKENEDGNLVITGVEMT